MPSFTYPTQGSLEQINAIYYFSKKKKAEGKSKNASSFNI
jgi:hypothetical protein